MKQFARRIIFRLEAAESKERYRYSFFLGLLLTLALPPFYFVPALLSFSGLLILLGGRITKIEAFFTGWWFGFGFFVLGLYWIANALLVDVVRFGWLIPFAICLLPAAFAIFTGIATLITHIMRLEGWRKSLGFTSIWLVMEIARSYLFTGFPWNLIGYSLDFSATLIQFASLTGIWGLSFAACLAGSIFYCYTKERNNKFALAPLFSTAVLIASMAIFGAVRLNTKPPYDRKVSISLVQPNITQSLKWEPAERLRNFLRHLDLTYSVKSKPGIPDIIIWPETAVPFLLEDEPNLRATIAKAMPDGSYLITGGIRVAKENGEEKIWNSLFVLNKKGEVLDHYDKSHLVPFGEYIPFRRFLPFIEKITYGSRDFSFGSGVKNIEVFQGFKISPLICYEIIFPGEVVEKASRSHMIVNITNDGWYGFSTGPFQHLETARLRAVEEGIPVARAANSGISAIFNEYGETIAKLGLNKKGIIQSEVELRNFPITTYGRFKLLVILPVIIILLLLCLFIKKK